VDRFVQRWWAANAAGFVIGHGVFSTIAHGITGDHGDQLAVQQYAAHTAGLVVIGALIFSLQRRALAPLRQVTWSRILVGIAVYVAAFWVGAETAGPPLDWLLGLTVLGTAMWIGWCRGTGAANLWALAALVGFALGIVAAVMAVGVWVRLFDPDHSTLPSLLVHTMGWTIIGGTTGIVGGVLGAWPLRRFLRT
jgi:hypothetical protein